MKKITYIIVSLFFLLQLSFAQTISSSSAFQLSILENGYNYSDSKNLMEFFNISPKNGEEIVLFSTNPNIGDNLANINSILESLHQKYPESKIKLVSPTSFLLKKNDWFTPVQIDLSKFNKPHKGKKYGHLLKYLEEQLANNVSAKSFVYIEALNLEPLEFRYFPLEDFVKKNMESAVLERYAKIINKKGGRGLLNYIEDEEFYIINKKKDIPKYVTGHPETHVTAHYTRATFDVPSKLFSEALPTDASVYQMLNVYNKIIWGEEIESVNPEYLYLNDGEFIKEKNVFLKNQFNTKERMTKRYVILNFNTTGEHKIDYIKDDYTNKVKSMINKIQLTYPDVKILLTPVESQFGKKIANEVKAFVNQKHLRDKVAFMPNDKKIWGRLIKDSELVITQDSGFNHIANIYKSEEKILVFSSDEMAKDWRRANQKYIAFFDGEKHFSRIEYFIDHHLSGMETSLTQKQLDRIPQRVKRASFWLQDILLPNKSVKYNCLLNKLSNLKLAQ